MSRRRDRKAMACWEGDTRRWAIDTARDLAVAVYRADPLPAWPYRIGIVLGPQETAWVECPARFNLDTAPSSTAAAGSAPYRPWLVSSERIVGRLGDDQLHGYRWDRVFGCRLDLTEVGDWLTLDVDGEPPLTWRGAGIAPIAELTASSARGCAKGARKCLIRRSSSGLHVRTIGLGRLAGRPSRPGSTPAARQQPCPWSSRPARPAAHRGRWRPCGTGTTRQSVGRVPRRQGGADRPAAKGRLPIAVSR